MRYKISIKENKRIAIKNTFKIALQYLFNDVTLKNIICSLKFVFLLKVDQKPCVFKLKEIYKKTFGDPVCKKCIKV